MNLSLTLIYFLEASLIVIALIYVLVASIKLVIAKNVPGSRLILSTIFFTIFAAVASASYSYVAEEVGILIEAVIDMALGLAFFIGALGFWRLSKFAINSSANMSLNRDAR